MDLAGWDLVAAVSIDAVNRRLAADQAQLVTGFDLASPVVATGSYASWQIVPGGSGELVFLALTLGPGTLQQGGTAVALAGGVLTVKVALALLPGTAGQTLQFAFAADTVTLVGLAGIAGLDEIAAAALGVALVADLCARAGQIRCVLATVVPVGQGGPAWLDPVTLGFAYAAPAGAPAMLGIFALTRAGDISTLGRGIDPAILGSGNVGLAISPTLFLTQVFAPALEAALNAAASSIVAQGTATLANAAPIPLPAVSRAGETYHPVVTSLSAVLRDDSVAVQIDGTCDMHMSIKMSFTATTTVGVALGSDGTLALTTLAAPKFTHAESVPWYDHLLDVLAPVIELVLDATVAAVSSALGNGISKVSGTARLLGQAPGIVGWIGTAGFTPGAASLDDALLLQGSIA